MKNKFSIALKTFYEISLEHRIFLVVGTLGVVFSVFTGVMNLVLDIGLIASLASFMMGAFALLVMWLSIRKKTYETYALISLIILTFVLYPAIWIISGGSKGTVPYFYIINLFFVPLVLKKNYARTMMILNILVVLTLLVLEYFMPSLIIGYVNDTIRMYDVGFILILICFCSYILAHLLIKAYNNKFDNLRQTQEKLKILSETDELTGVYNRRFIKESLLNCIENCKAFSVIMVDIDDFKEINDNYGHSIGDKVIIKICETLKSHIDEHQILGRIGGEEFLMIIEGIHEEKIYHYAEFLRLSIEELKFDEIDHPVTISLGTYNPDKSDSIDKILIEVDKSLYKAKNQGKNKVISSN